MRSGAAALVAVVCWAGLGRGQLHGRYPYPFVDVAKPGWLQVALNAGGIALAFILAGVTLVWVDSWRPLGPSAGRR